MNIQSKYLMRLTEVLIKMAIAPYYALPLFLKKSRIVLSIRRLVTDKISGNHRVIHKEYNDISWKDFSHQVLESKNSFQGIYIIEHVMEWHADVFQRPQQMAIAMGLSNYLVIYNTLEVGNDCVNGFRNVAKNVWLTNKWKEVGTIKYAVRAVYPTVFSKSIREFKSKSKNGIMVYEYIDHISQDIIGSSIATKKCIKLKNHAFSGGADYIVVSSKKLQEEAAGAVDRDRVVLVPNGVDVSHYRSRENKEFCIPEKLGAFNKKYKTIVGYFGAIAPWLWYEEIDKLAKKRLDLGFLFIGPNFNDGLRLAPVSDNILYLGAISYKDLPYCADCFDVCMIPFKPGDIAKSTSPLKLFEYFALEKPVVVTSEMDECTAYPEVFSGDSAETLSDAIDEAIKVKDDDAFKARMAQLADENTWIERAKAMSVCFGD